ncbi:MAG: T9SS type A sorting domain-containing protein [Bacteroidales bacterium]|nr:T9SS type A sorting domain-containing protein [Bacteroidales bacterium]MCF8376753.1 T9SS type A sorting domain-containing protein [Bacteroidales bacterium]
MNGFMVNRRTMNKWPGRGHLRQLGKAELYTILDNSTGRLNALIRNTLILCYTLTFEEPYVFPGGLKSRRIIKKPIPEIYNDPLFKVYPNPANSYIIIEFNSEISEINNKVSIFDNKARLVKTMYSAGKSYLIIRVSKLPAGIYFINLQNENKIYSEQFVITK